MKTVMTILGTRPEIIKLAPVIKTLGEYDDMKSVVLSTGQHREMSGQFFGEFGITPDVDLDIMKPNQSLSYVVSEMASRCDAMLDKFKPDVVLVQGDTATAAMGGLMAYFQKIAVGHVEAGLRTYDIYSPHPEEIDRQIISRFATFNFVPTLKAAENLRSEAIDPRTIHYVGNTVVDALQDIIAAHPECVPEEDKATDSDEKMIFVTAHRRENFGEPIKQICRAIKVLAEKFPNVRFVFPVHPNPNVRETVYEILSGVERVELMEPIGYLDLVKTIFTASIILTDSGGIQEEAPTFHKPVLVMRNETERPEGVDAGIARLLGTDPDLIIDAVSELLTDDAGYEKLTRIKNPYGDGRSAQRIVNLLRTHLGLEVTRPIESLEDYYAGVGSK